MGVSGPSLLTESTDPMIIGNVVPFVGLPAPSVEISNGLVYAILGFDR